MFRQGGHRLGGAQGEPTAAGHAHEQIAALRGKHSGDAILARYLKQKKFVKSAAADAERQKFLQVVDLFREYGEKYEVDWLLMAAQGYQESASITRRAATSAPSASCRSCPPPARG